MCKTRFASGLALLSSQKLGSLALLTALGAGLAAAPAHAQYCTTISQNCSADNGDERISHVTFADIDNDSGFGNGGTAPGCYSDFTAISTTVQPGGSYTITVTNAGPYSDDACSVWVDWNQDHVFATDAASAEQFLLTSPDGGSTFTGTIVVPATATLGNARLRIRLDFLDPPVPCGITLYGETEDYTVTVVAATSGACCAASGACAQTSSGECSGAFQGNGIGCSPANPCGGACCDSVGGTCTVTTSASCPSGSIYVDHRACSPTACSYCAAGALSCGAFTNDERISQFSFGDIFNNVGAGDGPAGCYADYTGSPTGVFIGQTYSISLTNTDAYGGDQAAAWFDFNNDLVFGDVASGEEVVLTSSDGGTTFMGLVTIPASAHAATIRLRVRLTDSGSALSPCDNGTYGEVQDYSVIVTQGASGVCCRGATCNASVIQANCVGSGTAGAVFATTSGACNAGDSTTTPCCYADYNKTGGITVADIFDYLNSWFAGSLYAKVGGDGASGTLAVQDIFDFLNAWFAGGC
jgi:hypothetical protein